jgi:CO/xanthine dehydrogenase FAD-binding subunit
MEYLRPKTLDEALEFLAGGVPLAGGTQLTPHRNTLAKVIDLQSLDLDEIREQDGQIQLGAMARLQAVLTTQLAVPEPLRQACRYEAAWNIRNQATLGGVLMGADSRSPLMTVLAALDPEIRLAPGDLLIDLKGLIERRKAGTRNFILLGLNFKNTKCLAYDYVARAPMDPPIVSAAAAVLADDDGNVVRISLGGFGNYPQFWSQRIETGEREALLEALTRTAVESYGDAGDQFASAEYRAAAAGILTRRVANEVLDAC